MFYVIKCRTLPLEDIAVSLIIALLFFPTVAFEVKNNCGIHYLIKLKFSKFKGSMLDKLSSRLPQARGAWQTALDKGVLQVGGKLILC